MNAKALKTLEYEKVLERLSGYCAFPASKAKALSLQPNNDLEIATRRLSETAEARALFALQPNTTIGGARDVREVVESTTRGVVLATNELLDVKATLISARNVCRLFDQSQEQYPLLHEIASRLPVDTGLVDAITKTLNDRGEVLDSASADLARIRRESEITHNRLLERMQRMVNSKKYAPHLQEALVTQRDGRYVLPIKAEARNRVKSVVHDQSSSGATLFVEPLEVVEINNKWRELQLGERDEERRILAALCDQIAEHAGEVTLAVEQLAEIDLRFASAHYADDLKASQPELVPFKPPKDGPNPGVTLRLWAARHPLLEPATVVPIDLELDQSAYTLVITGPNTGGKTVTLKTAGLLALMAQSGLHIPAQEGSALSQFNDIYADIGDEQSIEQSLSTFSGHITNIIRILDEAGPQDLVIFDELGAGTDPQEGAALAMALLGFLVDRGITTLVATHYPELKGYAHATPGVVNASMEFDLESLSPTYRLTIGLPGRSNALAIAKRLGLQDEVVDRARDTLDPAELRAEDLLDEIHRQRDLTRAARAAAEESRTEAEELRGELAARLETIEDERLEVLDAARHEAREQVAELEEEMRQARKELARARQPLDVLEQVAEKVEELEEEVAEPIVRQRIPEADLYPERPVRLGDRVKLRTLDQEGVVTALGEEEVEVQVGVLRVRARMTELQLTGVEQPIPQVEPPAPALSYTPESPGVEVSLRGMRADEAMEKLERHLDAAYVAGLPFVRIIHGKGTGKLREMVRKEMNVHPHVERWEAAKPNEGGEGATIAYLRN